MDIERLAAMIEKEDWEKALKCVDREVSHHPDSASAWLNRGALLYELVRANCRLFATNNFRWLVVLFDKSGRMDDEARERVVALIGQEHVRLLGLLLGGAERCLDKALTLEPGSNEYLWRGRLYRDTGRLESAESDLTKAVALADEEERENATVSLQSLALFDWDSVRRQVMSSGWPYVRIAGRYGKTVARIASTI